jgi:hypothetical protein
MGVKIMSPALNFEPKYMVTILIRKNWTKGTGTFSVFKGLVSFTDGSKMKEGTADGIHGKSIGRKPTFSLGR